MIKALYTVVLTRSGQACLGLGLAACLLSCGSGPNTATVSPPAKPPESGQLVISPAAMNFGTVVVNSSQNQSGSLTAKISAVTVSSAAWNGTGFSLSGITFPVTIPVGQSIPFIVTFAPTTGGSSSGSISFLSNASISETAESVTGTGIERTEHKVTLSWSSSSSQAVGYYVYRGTVPGGPYARLVSSPQPSTTYTDSTVQSGATYYYVTTAVNASSVESGYSNEVRAVIPVP